jgi:hypothetical protein
MRLRLLLWRLEKEGEAKRGAVEPRPLPAAVALASRRSPAAEAAVDPELAKVDSVRCPAQVCRLLALACRLEGPRLGHL